MHVSGLQCTLCEKTFGTDVLYTCPNCGGDGILDVVYDYDAVADTLSRKTLHDRSNDHWRYRELLPINDDASLPAIQIGWTPISEAPGLAQWAAINRLWLKDEGRNPTASLKDRASSIGVIKSREFGYDTIACASTGNAATSLAGMAATAGLSCYIFVPEQAAEAKLAQLLIFGAKVMRVRGAYDEVYDLCMRACEQYGWYKRNAAVNPDLVEGKKSCGLEIGEQMGENMPDWLAIPVGDGCTIAGIWKGITEMRRLGLIPHLPRLLGVQAEGAQALLQAFQTGQDLVPTDVQTLADGIAVGTPHNWRKAVRAVQASEGDMIAVSDDEILIAMRVTARLGGIFGEPAGVAALAGIRRAVGNDIISKDESVLTVITGNGLKDVQSARQATREAFLIAPNMEALQEQVNQIEKGLP
ncbi:MAG: threonine synthase [bacterium]